MVLGTGEHSYRFVNNWARLPMWWKFKNCTDVAVDSQDKVFVFDRGGAHPVIVLDTKGNFLSAWGEGLFRTPHNIYVDRKDFVWTVDCGSHVVCKFAQDGSLLLTLGTRDIAGATYYGEPFNMPTGVAVSSDESIYVSDGYGNHKVQKFSPEGKRIGSWGQFGTGPGEFALVHSLDIDDDDNVYVCDRENGRIQIFDKDGKYLREWKNMKLPENIHIRGDVAYVSDGEIGEQFGPPRIRIFSLDGTLLTTWSTVEGEEKGTLWLPHGLTVDSHGDIYTAELDPNTFEENAHASEFCARIGKFERAS
jgi:DNA-binding beta-propeller fold protein YncE